MAVEGERELEEFLASHLRGEASTEEVEPPTEESEEEPIVVPDARPGQEEAPPATEPEPEPEPEAEVPPEPEPAEDDHVAWAKKKYGEDTEKWARAAREQETHISRLTNENREKDALVRQAWEYAQQVQAQAEAQASMTMPLSASEEAWLDQAMMNPTGFAYDAARQGNIPLYRALLARVSEEEHPAAAQQIEAQVQYALNEELRQAEAARASANNGQPGGDFFADMRASCQRLGIDINEWGQEISDKIDELGEGDLHTQMILGGTARERDSALKAVYELVRERRTTTRRVADTDREEQIRREGELRREAASVVTGAPHVPPPQPESPFMQEMIEELKRRGQWAEE